MGLRSVRVTSESGERKRLDHVVGVDESGNPDGSGGPFALSAVQCPRNYGEELAEQMVDVGLNPWRTKSNSLSVSDEANQDERVESFVDSISFTPVTWCCAIGWEAYSVPTRAAIACNVASKTLTTPHNDQIPNFEGDTVLIHDGSAKTYGEKQRYLRKKASANFDPSFQSKICSVYTTSLPKGDLTYPEVTAADYIAGYIRKKLSNGETTVERLPSQVLRVDSGWACEDIQPAPFYSLQTSGANQAVTQQSRIIAWIEGRKPPKDGFPSGRQFESVIENRLTSVTLKEYLSGIK